MGKIVLIGYLIPFRPTITIPYHIENRFNPLIEVLSFSASTYIVQNPSTETVLYPDSFQTSQLYTITVISFLNSFKVFREAYLVAGSYPHESMYLLQHLFNNWFTNLELDKMAAAAVCIFFVLFLVVLLLQKIWGREESD